MIKTLPLLLRGAIELGIHLSDYQLTQFEIYHRQLLDWNEKFNLTSITTTEEIQTRHFLDSLSAVMAGIGFDDKNIIDIGSGAGFPGLPLKIVFPDIQLTLLEATGKKAGFLESLIKELKLDGVTVVNDRAENTGHEARHREHYGIVISRAVASLNALCELCLPFCRVGGVLIAMKKGDLTEELEAAKPAMTLLGGQLRGINTVRLSDLPDERQLIIIEKTALTPVKFPRRSGLPAKKPLC
ncbi:MAG: 16S rRNA (guanine(527)-N(7))-methyltransferase RsmG [Dehalococcoidia bacterium]|nr:MAG: 16S rRNA (guanine(527)-N(7))-methyltransferase RsmG [Dehalococcoidia bacterium]